MISQNGKHGDAKRWTADGHDPIALAMLRALTHASSDIPGFQDYVVGVCRSLPSAERASVLLDWRNYRPISLIGKEAIGELQKAYEHLLTFAYPTHRALRELNDAVRYAASLVDASEQALYERWDALPDILGAQECDGFLAFHTELLQAVSHTVAMNFGTEPLAPLRRIELDTVESSYEALYVAQKSLIAEVNGRSALGSWAIVRTERGDGFFDGIRGYIFTMIGSAVGDYLKGRLYKKMASNVYVAEDASSEVIVGWGYLLGTDFRTSFKLRDDRVHTTLPLHAFERTRFDVDDPLGSVREFFEGDDAFCIHPEQLALAMDRAERGCGVAASTAHRCPSCGKPANNTLFCAAKRRR